jgi:hypothetical protein
VKTVDGVEHVLHYTKDLLVHGGKGSGVDALAGLQEGGTIVAHYTVNGSEETVQEIDQVGGALGLKTAEGTLVGVDRKRKEISIRFADGITETLQLTDRASAEGGNAPKQGERVIIYYANESGHRVAHYFKRIT